ncbi:MAG: hypothetical protein ACYDC6_13090 [Acidobacteriaceae bacterium]
MIHWRPRIVALFGCLWLFLPLAASAQASGRVRVYTDPDAYAVYSALLPHLWPWTQLDAGHLVIQAATRSHVVCVTTQNGAANGPAARKATPDGAAAGANSVGNAGTAAQQNDVTSAIDQYKQANTHSWLLQRKLNISRSYTFIGSGELEGIAQHRIGAWDLFFERHADSGGWIQFSAVGFSADKKTAVVYAEYACGRQCGGGALYLLRKKGAQWELAAPLSNSCNQKSGNRQMTGF